MVGFIVDGFGRKGHIPRSTIAILAAGLLVFSNASPRLASAQSYSGPIVDAHSQIDRDTSPDKVIEWLNSAGISRVILAARRGRNWRDIARLATDHPNRVTAAVRTKGRSFEHNERKYYKRLRKQLDHGAFDAMAEVILWHAEKGDKAPQIIVEIDAPQTQAALREALGRGWPFVVHIEFAAATAVGDGKQYMEALEKLLRAHPKHPFALIHMGQLEPDTVDRLINAHANIYFLTSHANPIVTRNSRQPWVDMFLDDRLTPAWRGLIIQYPERFVLAFDNVWDDHWGSMYDKQVKLWREALASLPLPIAHAIAHRNAERLWKLPPSK